MLTATYQNTYINAKKNKVMSFVLAGTIAELNQYRELQGANLREDSQTGAPLFFLTAFDNNGNRRITGTKMNVVYRKNEARGTEGFYYDEFGKEQDQLTKADDLVIGEIAKFRAAAIMTKNTPTTAPAAPAPAVVTPEAVFEQIAQGAGTEQLEG